MVKSSETNPTVDISNVTVSAFNAIKREEKKGIKNQKKLNILLSLRKIL